jgi:hypothetical protein
MNTASVGLLPGDRLPEVPVDWEPSAGGFPPVAAQIGTAVESALLLLEARRWWLDQYHVETPWREPELDAITRAIDAIEVALVYQQRGLAWGASR